MTARRCLSIAAMLLLAGSAPRAESMRCGSSIVDETTSVAELLAKCGEPAMKDVKSEDVLVRNPNTGLMRKIGTKITELWVYKRNSGSLPMAVTIVDGKVTRLERAN